MAQYVEPKTAFDSGKKAKVRGFARISPYYEDALADKFWFAGFDGLQFDEIGKEETHPTPNNIPTTHTLENTTKSE